MPERSKSLVAVDLDDPRLNVRGALDVTRSKTAIRTRRLPAWTRSQSPEPSFELMVSMSSGVRLSLTTDSDVLEVDLLETGLQFAGEPRREATVQLLVDGELFGSKALTAGRTLLVDGVEVRVLPGAAGTLRFEGLGRDHKVIDLWLPQSSITEVQGLRLGSNASLGAAPSALRWAHYGSSISHGMEAAGPAETWPAIVARGAGLDLTNLGFSGQCHLDGFVARSIRDGGFDQISLKLGANVVAADTFRRRTFASAVHNVLDIVREGCPQTPIQLISPIYCPLLEETTGPVLRNRGGGYSRLERPFAVADGALNLSDVRVCLAQLVERRQAADPNLSYIDGLSLFSSADAALMPDQLHPDPQGHRLMAERYAALIA